MAEQQKSKDQLDTGVNIIAPEIPLGQRLKVFDTGLSSPIYTTDEENRYGEESIFSLNEQARLQVNLVHNKSEVGRSINKLGTQVYFFVLEGRLDHNQDSIKPSGFLGPIHVDEKLEGSFKAVQIIFSAGNLNPTIPQFVSVPKINLADLPTTTNQTLIGKKWLTGSFGSFNPNTPGYNEFVHIGIGRADTEIKEARFHAFRDYSPQVVIPIPTEPQPDPAVIYDYIQLGYGSGMLTMRMPPERIRSYQAAEASHLADYAQRKLIKRGSMILIINTMNPDRRYTKIDDAYHIDQFPWLQEFEGDVWSGKIKEPEWWK